MKKIILLGAFIILCSGGCDNPEKADKEDIMEKFMHVVQSKKDPQHQDEALFKTAIYNLKLKKYFSAKKYLKEHYNLYPDSSHRDKVVHYLAMIETISGDELYAKGEWQDALVYYEEAFNIDLLNLEIVEKIQQCKLKIKKDRIRKIIISGDLNYEMGRLSDASVAYNKAVKLDPDNIFVKEKRDFTQREMQFEKEFEQKQEEFKRFHIERGFTRVDGVWVEK